MIVIFVSIILFIILATVPLFRDPSLKTRVNLFKFYAYWVCFVYGGPCFALYITKYLWGPIKSRMEENENVGIIRRILLERLWDDYFSMENHPDNQDTTSNV